MYSSPASRSRTHAVTAVVVLGEVDQFVVEAHPARRQLLGPVPAAPAPVGSAAGSSSRTGWPTPNPGRPRRRPTPRSTRSAGPRRGGRRTRRTRPRPACARVGCPGGRSRRRRPTSRRISIVRWLSTWALGRIDVVGAALTRRASTPRPARSIEAVSPAPPPPTIRTGTSISAMATPPRQRSPQRSICCHNIRDNV